MSGGPKISPRKFSEKIALLNKKTEEGNAKFEEIIKEVQSTKSKDPVPSVVDVTSDFGRVLRKSSQEKVEEYYESILRDVNQYDDDEIQNNPLQNQSFGPPQVFGGTSPIESQMISTNQHHSQSSSSQFEMSIKSASAEICHAKPTSNHQVRLNAVSREFPYIPDLQAQQQLNSDFNYNCTEFVETHHQPTNDLNCNILFDSQQHQPTRSYPYELEDSIPNQAQIQQQQQPSSIRARVTSIGSAHCNKYMGGNVGHQVKGHCNQGTSGNNWLGTGTGGAYLSEPCEKSWQKSSSDPALHVLPTPFNNINSCSDLELGGAINSGVTNRNNQGYQLSVGSNYNNTSMNQQPRGEVMMMEATDLPGIKICPFEDDGQQLIGNPGGVTDQNSNPNNSREDLSKDGSLPDITKLQFSMSPDGHQQQVQSTSDLSATQPTFGCHQQMSNPLSTQSVMLGQAFSNMEGVRECERQSRQVARNPPVDWTTEETSQLKNINTNNLSHSTSGLSMHHTNSNGLNTSDLYDSIIRSRSHNSIDHLTRQKISSQTRIGPYPLGHHSPQNTYALTQRQRFQNVHKIGQRKQQNSQQQHQKQQLQHQNQDSMQPAYLVNWDPIDLGGSCNTRGSMRPLRGSMSPLGSSSNLASPQSEANSPGGCGGGEGEVSNNKIGSEFRLSYETWSYNQKVATTLDQEPSSVCPSNHPMQQQKQQQPAYQMPAYQQQQQNLTASDSASSYLPTSLGQSLTTCKYQLSHQEAGLINGHQSQQHRGSQQQQQGDSNLAAQISISARDIEGGGGIIMDSDNIGASTTLINTHSIHGLNSLDQECNGDASNFAANTPFNVFSRGDGIIITNNQSSKNTTS